MIKGTNVARIDYRINSLEALFLAYDKIIDYNKEHCFCEVYDDETYFIYGIMLVSLQNYINQNCSRFLNSKVLSMYEKSDYYKIHSRIIQNDVTEIQLIIHLANYFKHVDDSNYLHKYTLECLQNVGLLDNGFTKETELEDRVNRFEYCEILFDGIRKISSFEEPLFNFLTIVKKWREDIWDEYNREESKEKNSTPIKNMSI